MTDLKHRLSDIKSFISFLENSKKIEDSKLSKIEDNLKFSLSELDTLEKTQELLSNLTKLLIDRELKPIEDFVTFGLKKVFVDRDLSLRIEKSETSTGTKYEFILRDGDIEAPISDNFGGSVEEVISLMLRLMVLQRLGKAKFLALDEFFTGVDSRHRPNLINLLRILCEKAGFDIFLITHQEDFINGAHTVLQAYTTVNGMSIKEISMSGSNS